VLIGERLNPTGKKRLAAALSAGDLSYVQQEARAQVDAGADILDVNVGVSGLDEPSLMAQAVEAIMSVVDVPLCLDSNSAQTLEAALRVYQGKPLINSVNAEERSLETILPLVKEYDAAVIALPMDEKGIPGEAGGRTELAHKIIERAQTYGISADSLVFDALAMSVGADRWAGVVTLETIRRLKADFGVNQTLGASNVSFGLPDRSLVNNAFLPMAMAAGVNCPVVDAVKAREMVLAADLVLGLDEFARRYIGAFRQRQAAQAT
jgi:5-methyltetrahydrofolate--homocysteine methyltransferase